MVVTSRPSASNPNIKHERIDRPSTRTVQVPHSPSSQPCFVPVKPRSSRSTSSSVLCGAKATSTGSPFSSKTIFTLASGGGIHAKRKLDNRHGPRQLWARMRADWRTAGQAVGRMADGQTGGLAVGLVLLSLSAGPAVHLSAQDFRAQALRILKTVPLIDGHNDIPDAIRERGGLDSVDFAVLQPKLMSDIPKLRAGGVGAQFWAAYVPVTTIDSGTHPAVYALEQIDLIKRLCAKYPRDLAMARTAADVERNFKAGKISCLIGIEGGHAIENSLGALRMFAALGVRYITLTHWRSLSWATASTDTARRGLSAFGRDVVHEMNRLGIVVDLSHVNDATMSDALHATRAPVMFSHSSARTLTGHARDVPDSILKLVPANGGIVMVNFNPGFVSEAVRVYEDSKEARAW